MMGRRFPVAFLLLFLLAGRAGLCLKPLLAAKAHDCRCNERICRCAHQHRKPVVPKCHFPGGTNLPTVQSCDNDQQQALASASYLLPPRTPLTQPLPVAALSEPLELQCPVFFDDINPPPPRTLPA